MGLLKNVIVYTLLRIRKHLTREKEIKVNISDVVKTILWWTLMIMFGVSAFILFTVLVGGLFNNWALGMIAGIAMAGTLVFALNK